MLTVTVLLQHAIWPAEALHAQDWPRWRGPNGNGTITTEEFQTPTLSEDNIRWTLDIGAGLNNVVVEGDRLYAAGSPRDSVDQVACYNSHTARLIWKFDYPCPVPNGCFECYKGPRASPMLHDGRLYTLSHQGQLHCFNADDGALLWSRHLVNDFDAMRPKYGFSGSPVVDSGRLLLNARDGGLALNPEDGSLIWDSGAGKASYSTPVAFDHKGTRAVMLFARKKLICRRLSDGHRLWQQDWPYVNNDGAAEVDPVILGEKVFISSGYRKGGAVYDFSGRRPRELWFDSEIRTEFGTALFHDGTLLAPHGDTRRTTAYLKCVDFNTGHIYWTEDTGHCSLIKINEYYAVLNQWGQLTIARADRRGYEAIASIKIFETSPKNRCWSHPVFAHGDLFIRRWDGALRCITLTDIVKEVEP